MIEKKDSVNGQVLVGFKEFVKKKWGTKGLSFSSHHLTFDLNTVIKDREYPIRYALEVMEKVFEPRLLPQAVFTFGWGNYFLLRLLYYRFCSSDLALYFAHVRQLIQVRH